MPPAAGPKQTEHRPQQCSVIDRSARNSIAVWQLLAHRMRDQRGHAVSVLALVVVPAIMMIAGLVIDGGQRAQAASRAESVAAGAARAAGNAGITAGFGNGSTNQLGLGPARQAAENYIHAAADGKPKVTGRVSTHGRRVTVHTQARARTIFLSLIGIDTVRARGSAEAEVVAVR
jgi:hypothetical protein